MTGIALFPPAFRRRSNCGNSNRELRLSLLRHLISLLQAEDERLPLFLKDIHVDARAEEPSQRDLSACVFFLVSMEFAIKPGE